MMTEIRRVRSLAPPIEILHIDESQWLVIQPAPKTIVETGAESVHVEVLGDPKAGFTFMACISLDGEKYPLFFLAKGKSTQCHKQLMPDSLGRNYIWHSESGWMDQQAFEHYLSWIRQQCPGKMIAILLDQYGTHISAKAHEAAQKYGILLIPVPKGGTGRYQPLDLRVFGCLKSIGRSLWTRMYTRDPTLIPTKMRAANLLIKSWSAILPNVIQSAWQHAVLDYLQ
jgi:hypothetical protein